MRQGEKKINKPHPGLALELSTGLWVIIEGAQFAELMQGTLG